MYKQQYSIKTSSQRGGGGELTWHNKEKLSHSKFKSLAIAEGVAGYTTNLIVAHFFICKIRDFDGLDFWDELRMLVS